MITISGTFLATNRGLDFFKILNMHWPSDPMQVNESAMPSRYACGSLCSIMGLECTMFEFTAGSCKLAKRIGIDDLGAAKKPTWVKMTTASPKGLEALTHSVRLGHACNSFPQGLPIEYPFQHSNLLATASSVDGQFHARHVFDGDPGQSFCSHGSDAQPWLKVDMEHQFHVTKVVTWQSLRDRVRFCHVVHWFTGLPTWKEELLLPVERGNCHCCRQL